ncbi:MAG: histidine kinase [Terracidiphilus sp.]|nr:histidine kinase [Terracidiphilus sp.]
MTKLNDIAGYSDDHDDVSGRRWLLRMLWFAPAIALLVTVLFLVFGHQEISAFGQHLLAALIYATLIGIPSSYLLNWLGFHCSERWPRLIMLLYAAVLVVTATVGTALGALLMQTAHLLGSSSAWTEFRGSYPVSLLISLVLGLSISSFETMRHKLHYATLELRTQQMEQERANKLLAEAQLSSLESRIHPHFLFNTLNSIAALIPSDPKRAEETVARLASLLRFSLNSSQQSLVPLEQELKIVRDYLEIETTRFGARLRYSINAGADTSSYKVPPLALATLVENAVKHVVARRTEGATIAITATSTDGRLILDVADDGPGFELGKVPADHGLGNLAARLDLLLGARASLDVLQREGSTVVRITMPAEQ